MRVRSEYWAITPKLFYEIVEYYHTIKYEVNDPSLFALLYCLRNDKKVRNFDLGKYKIEDQDPTSKPTDKLKRASDLIDSFRNN